MMTTFHPTEGAAAAVPKVRRRRRQPATIPADGQQNPVTTAMDATDDDDHSVLSATSTLSRATMATALTKIELQNETFQQEMRDNMNRQFQDLFDMMKINANHTSHKQASPPRTASPGDEPFSTEESAPAGSSAR